jgi:hypothetical protein
MSTLTSPLNKNSFTLTPGDYTSAIHPVPQSFTIHAMKGYGRPLGNNIATLTCAEGAVNPTIQIRTTPTGAISVNGGGAAFTFNGGDDYHVSVTKSGLDLIIFAQRFDNFESKWETVTTDCMGVSQIDFDDAAG